MRVLPWMIACFGSKISQDTVERNHRFIEEALELIQACGCPREDAMQLVNYVYSRPIGEQAQEVGGVMVTLAALCLANGIDMHEAAEVELKRIWTKVEQIRAKQAAKPRGSALPQEFSGTLTYPTPTRKELLAAMPAIAYYDGEGDDVLLLDALEENLASAGFQIVRRP